MAVRRLAIGACILFLYSSAWSQESDPPAADKQFQTLAENGVRLCAAEHAFIFRYDGQLLRMVNSYNALPERIAFVQQHPVAPGRTGAASLEVELSSLSETRYQVTTAATTTASRMNSAIRP